LGKRAIQMKLQVSCTLKFFIDDIIHSGACIDKGRSQNGQTAAFFDITCSTEKAFRSVECSGVNTSGERSSARWNDKVISTRQPGDTVHQNNHISFMLDKSHSAFKYKLSHFNMIFRNLIKCGADNLCIY